MTKSTEVRAVPGVDHLYVRGTKYYFLMKVPKALVPHCENKQQIREALKTDSLEVAKSRVMDRAFFWKKEFERLALLQQQAFQPISYLNIDEDTAQALLWRARFVWDGLRLAETRPASEFTEFSLRILRKMKPDYVDFSPAKLRRWYETIELERDVVTFGPMAEAVLRRTAPAMHYEFIGAETIAPESQKVYALEKKKVVFLQELIDRFDGDYQRANIKSSSKKNYAVPFQILVDVFGADKPVHQIDRDAIKKMVDDVFRWLPRWAKKRPEYKEMSYPKIAALAHAKFDDGAEVDFIEDAAINKYLGFIGTLFGYALREQIIVSNPALDIKLPGVPKSEKRAFSLDELKQLFHRKYQFNAINWIPVVCLYQGLRPNECCQLDTADVFLHEVHGFWCVRITVEQMVRDRRRFRTMDGGQADAGKTLKTIYSRRTLPLNQQLIALGFLDYVQARRDAKTEKLFNVTCYKDSSYYYDSVRKVLKSLFEEAGIWTDVTTLHSLRHAFADAIRNNTACPKELREAIGGWSISGSTEIDYGKEETFGPHKMKPWVDQVMFPGLFAEDPPQSREVLSICG